LKGERKAVKLKNGEYAVLLKNTKSPNLRCKECKRVIGLGEGFWLDYIPLRFPTPVRRFWKKVICRSCWKAPVT